MTPRECVLAAARRQRPERVPYELPYGSFTPDLMEVFYRETGAEDPAEYFGYPTRSVGYKGSTQEQLWERYERYYPEPPANASIGEFGSIYVQGSLHHFTHTESPLRNAQSVREIEEYPLPDLGEEWRWTDVPAKAQEFQDRGLAVIGGLECSVFEVGWAIRGLEETFMDLYERPEIVDTLFERLTEIRCVQARRFAEAGVDVLRLGDDIAGQIGMMFDIPTWERFLKHRLARIIRAAREVNPDLAISYHSDGNCTDAVPGLIDCGVTILNPVQPECMDPVAIKRRFGDRLALWGTIGTQTTMPFGTPADVRAEVKQRIETLGRDGGLILAPSHILEPDVPWENVLAFIEAAREFGGYV